MSLSPAGQRGGRSVVSCCAAASWRAEACGAMRAGFGSEGSADGGGARLRAERERDGRWELTSASFFLPLPPLLLFFYSGVALLSVAAGGQLDRRFTEGSEEAVGLTRTGMSRIG